MFTSKNDYLNYVINILIILTLLLAVLLRVFELGNIPGVNGDEAWYGLIALKILSGEMVGFATPSGLLINPIYLLPVTALHLIFEPSFFLLRVPALVSGLLLIVLSYYLSKKILNDKAAIIVMLVVASLPVNIVYSRFGWDASQTVLASCVVVYALLSHRWLLFSISLVAAILIHPTNVALLLIAVIYIAINKKYSSQFFSLHKFVSISSLFVLFIGMYLIVTTPTLMAQIPSIHSMLTNAADFENVGEFFLNVSRLFSGTTVYLYISGAKNSFFGNAIDIILMFAICSLFIYMLAYSYKLKDKKIFSFVLSVSITMAIWFLSFTNNTLVPGRERYSLFLIMPVVICFGFFCLIIMENIKYEKIIFATLIFCNLMMAGFIKNYFIQFYNTGGESAQTFKTNYVEPKKMVFDKVKGVIGDETVYLISSDWWNSQPLLYLSMNNKQINVIETFSLNSSENISLSNKQIIFINTFINDKLDNLVTQRLSNEIKNAWVFPTFSDEPLMMLYQMNPLELDLNFEIINQD
ncbi:MAG: hypothetical protein ACI9XC_000344 [Gammaproteobacteria bacterium]|jgi:hypothetical protein